MSSAEPAPAVEPLVLVVDDEPQLRRFLRATLPAHGYRLVEAETAGEALREAATRTPDVILLDLGLPDMDGVEVTRRLREWTATPIIVLSARDQERDKIEALDAGADDYLTKPFATGELLARVRVALRHAASGPAGVQEPVFELQDLKVDLGAHPGLRGRARGAPHAHRIPAARAARETRRPRGHAPPAPEGGLGTGLGRAHALSARLHGTAPAQARDGPRRPRYLLTETGVGYRLRAD